jgi:hypothetical protein
LGRCFGGTVIIESFGDWRMQRKSEEPCKNCERPWTHAVWNIETHYLTHLCEECARDLVSREGSGE